jgi:hypothetical protein
MRIKIIRVMVLGNKKRVTGGISESAASFQKREGIMDLGRFIKSKYQISVISCLNFFVGFM